jgi:hypothetical protein
MQRAIIFALLLFFPTVLHARVIKWEGKPVSVSVSTERLTRIEFPEMLRSVVLSRSDIAIEREEKSLYIRGPGAGGRRRSVRRWGERDDVRVESLCFRQSRSNRYHLIYH